jgi:hypothetical protein
MCNKELKHLAQQELGGFIKQKLSRCRAKPLPLAFIDKPCLISASKEAMYLVLHGIYLKKADQLEVVLRDASNLCVLVQFLAPEVQISTTMTRFVLWSCKQKQIKS